MIYLQLFWSFLQIGAFSFGGGYAAMPLIQEQVVTVHGWLSMREFSDLVTISQMTPGPIAVNSATFVGLKLAGFGGAAAATFGCVLPSCLMVTALAYLYLRYRRLTALQDILASLRPAVVAMIAAAGMSILVSCLWGGSKGYIIQNIHLDSAVIFLAALALLRIGKKNPITVMILCGVMKAAVLLLSGAN